MWKLALFLQIIVNLCPLSLFAQQNDSIMPGGYPATSVDSTSKDSIAQNENTISIISPPPEKPSLNKIVDDNVYLNTKGKSVVYEQVERRARSNDALFYILALVILFFGILKLLYPRYFSNLFRVFFNTSLRQSQLTDQLLQAKLPSLFFNIFFILMGAWYIYLLLNHFGKIDHYRIWQVLPVAVACLSITYLFKFGILKFTGWITGYRQEADTYIFIVFLINKIVAICLIPLVIIMAFSDKVPVEMALLLSFLVIGLMLLMRFIRSYSLLQNRLKVSRFHFLIYLVGIEIVPILVLYKLALLFISKKL